ncbi:hypothetical protein K3495_g12629 [Podosphaera aphanis]|nr:hypothetical protein K3495_g12629 [Podosphaera aphanis]
MNAVGLALHQSEAFEDLLLILSQTLKTKGKSCFLPLVSIGKKAAQYVSTMKRPNMHIAVHYTALVEEYGLSVNVNVLVGEDKYQAFKKMIYTTNHRYPEKDLLTKENLRQTIRLLLADAFKYDDPTATQLKKDIHAQCPALFATILPRSEQMSSATAITEEEDELCVVGDTHHIRPNVTGCIQPRFVHTGSTFVWTKKFAFYDPIAQRRCTFKIGDFIRLQGDRDKDVVRVDQILVHTRERRERLFIKTTPLSLLPLQDDSMLGRGYHRMMTTDWSSHNQV